LLIIFLAEKFQIVKKSEKTPTQNIQQEGQNKKEDDQADHPPFYFLSDDLLFK